MFPLGRNRCIVFPIVACNFIKRSFAMSSGVEDLQMVRLIRAFQTDQDVRRLVVAYVEEQLEKQQARARQNPWRTEHWSVGA